MVSINMVKILMSTIMATLGLLEIKLFWNKSYDVITSVHDLTNNILSLIQIILQRWSRNQNLVTLEFP